MRISLSTAIQARERELQLWGALFQPFHRSFFRSTNHQKNQKPDVSIFLLRFETIREWGEEKTHPMLRYS
jgi:hypothetical protein